MLLTAAEKTGAGQVMGTLTGGTLSLLLARASFERLTVLTTTVLTGAAVSIARAWVNQYVVHCIEWLESDLIFTARHWILSRTDFSKNELHRFWYFTPPPLPPYKFDRPVILAYLGAFLAFIAEHIPRSMLLVRQQFSEFRVMLKGQCIFKKAERKLENEYSPNYSPYVG